MSSGIEFNEAEHSYKLKGRQYLSVTKILEAAGLTKRFDGVDPFYAQRGTMVHKATEFDDRRTLDEEGMDDQIGPYLKAYREWKALVRPEILAIEKRFVHESLEYAGTIDRVAIIGKAMSVIDVKTGNAYPSHAIQLAAYAMAENSKSPQTVARYALYLSKEGRFKMIEHKDHGDFLVWQSALYIARWQRRVGL